MQLNKNLIFTVFMLLFLIADTLTNVILKLSIDGFLRYAGYTKLLFEIFMVVSLALNIKKLHKSYIFLILFSFLFIISQFLYSEITQYNIKDEFLVKNVYFFNRYFYILIFVLYIKTFSLKETTFHTIYKCFEYFLLINSLFILIGLFTEINFFKSYSGTNRFGYTGLLSKSGETAYLYIIMIVTNYYFWIKTKEFKFFYKALFFSIIALLIGKKMVLLFIFLLVLYHLLQINKYKKWFRYVTFLTLPVVTYFWRELIEFILNFLPSWNQLADEKGILSAITSFRSDLLKEVLIYVKTNWSLWNYLFGGIDLLRYKTEFELVDLYFLMGLSGVLMYAYIVYYKFIKGSDFLIKMLIIIVFLSSFFAGGLLLSVTAIAFFYLTTTYILKNPDDLIK